MYRALDNLRKAQGKNVLKDGTTVGGKAGRLTTGPTGAVTRLSELYENAIRKTVNREAAKVGGEEKKEALSNMQRTILAVLHHSCKTRDDKERHQYCPKDDFCEFRNRGKMPDKGSPSGCSLPGAFETMI